MPPQAWNDKRERQYEHIKEGLEEQGRVRAVAEEIAARTVNKERARAGEARTAIEDVDRRHLVAAGAVVCDRTAARAGATRDQLYEEARHKNIKGRSKMTKAQLERAVDR